MSVPFGGLLMLITPPFGRGIACLSALVEIRGIDWEGGKRLVNLIGRETDRSLVGSAR